MVRELSGVTRGEIIHHTFVPVTWYENACMTNINSHPAANLDHATDACYLSYILPSSDVVRAIKGIYLILLGKADITNMHLDIAENHGSNGEALAAATTVTAHRTTVTNQYDLYDISGIINCYTLGHVYGLKIYYNASVPATNVYVLGIMLDWV